MKKDIRLSHIAGYVTEKAVWQLLQSLSIYCRNGELCGVTASDIVVSGSVFSIDKHNVPSDKAAGSFSAPELFQDTTNAKAEPSCVWTLGALAFYAITGIDVFEGKGGATQTQTTNVPRIGSAYASEQLSALIRQCLSYSPSDRPSSEDIVRVSKEAIEKPASPRKRLVSNNGRSYITSIVKFWPEEMVPMLIICMLFLSSLSVSAQNGIFDKTAIPNEMVNLVMRCIDLRSPANVEKVRKAMSRDMNWTMMDELPVDKKGECTIKQPVDMFGLNDMGFGILKLHGGVTNSGGRFRDGRDPRYKYSFIEVTVRKDASVNYVIDGREGLQMFAVVPFDKGAKFVASIPSSSSFIDNGVCYIRRKQPVKKADKFNWSIKNESGKNAAFVIINYNSRKNE